MKIRMVLGCSECETAYNYDKIEYDLTKNYAKIPVCKDDAEHSEGYSDILVPVLLLSDFEKEVDKAIAIISRKHWGMLSPLTSLDVVNKKLYIDLWQKEQFDGTFAEFLVCKMSSELKEMLKKVGK